MSLRAARRTWRLVVLATQIPLTRTLPPCSADMASGGSCHADTINSYPTYPACFVGTCVIMPSG